MYKYIEYHTLLSWTSAESHCYNNYNGRLTSISDGQEMRFIYKWLKQMELGQRFIYLGL